ncbi:MAG: AAA family ATPase [Saccharospirillum sp.]
MSANQEIESFQIQLRANGYVCDSDLAASLMLMASLQRPLLLEGDAGVGKTEVAKALSSVYQCPLIRLQCYEGLDVNTAIYEWNYQHQLLAIKLMETQGQESESTLFGERYLLKRPLLQAITQPQSPVLLVDEIDRADEEFEAFLLEVLSDFQISIPEMGTITATSIPHVILTSNGTRELSDALRRRCLYHYTDYPSFDKEFRIVTTRLPHISQRLAAQVVEYVQQLRRMDLRKNPGIAETLDWAAALFRLKVDDLKSDPAQLMDTLACLLKTREDKAMVSLDVSNRLVARAG